MLIDLKLIMKPRVSRVCSGYQKQIPGWTFRLFGAASKFDTPYVIYLCWCCGVEKGYHSEFGFDELSD